MAEPLKNLYNKKLISSLGSEIKKVYKKFDAEKFQKAVFCKEWEQKELKKRMRFIARTLSEFLPADYEKAIAILMPVSAVFDGFEYMFFPDFVECYGLENFNLSMEALARFTEHSSSEFAVRAFIKKYPERTMAEMARWAESGNKYLRRLASEGCRPRLPWACALPEFKKNPAPALKIIKKLLNDKSEYVRRSAANNLNDISKDNPRAVINLAKKNKGKNKNTERLLKHGCRSLLRAGNAEVLALFGFTDAKHVKAANFKAPESVMMGQSLRLSFTLKTREKKLGRLRLEYAVDFKKSNGKSRRKIFKISEGECALKEKSVTTSHSFRSITTRKHYPGVHGIAIIVNGMELACRSFRLNEKN
ncbi:MAG: DNA alkylation repair protein [Thermodesulfobacteriota bacterium]